MQELPNVLDYMVSCTVVKDDRILSPIGSSLVQRQYQAPWEHQHQILISVSLCQGEIYPTLYV